MVQIRETRAGRLVRSLNLGDGAHVTFSPDGRWLAAATGEAARLWRVGSGQPGPRFPREDPEVVPGYAAFGPGGRVVAVTHSRRVMRLVDL